MLDVKDNLETVELTNALIKKFNRENDVIWGSFD